MNRSPWFWIPALALATALPFAACSSNSPTAGGAGGGVTHGTDGGADGPVCTGILQSSSCADCLVSSCCAELSACNDDSVMMCLDCATGVTTGAACTTTQPTAGLLGALYACLNTTCAAACPAPLGAACDAPATSPSSGFCYTGTGCNPVSNATCAAGASCDSTMSGFQCYAPPPANTAAACAVCDSMNGPECLPGSTCLDGLCFKYCCDDGDCGSGSCDKDQTTNDPDVGLCVKNEPIGDGGADGGADGGGDAGAGGGPSTDAGGDASTD
jgi:hypothetical protein